MDYAEVKVGEMIKQTDKIREAKCRFCGKIFKSRTNTKICLRCYLGDNEDIERSINISNVISIIMRMSVDNEKTN
jgi:hypothetical protein